MVLGSVAPVQEQLGLDFGAPPRKLVRVTPAKLATWADCPRRFRMAYVDRPSPARGGPWAHSAMGAAVHNALKALFDLPPAQRSPDRAVALLTRAWKSDGFRDAEQSWRYRDRAAGWVRDYVEDLDTTIDPIGVERWVSAPTGTIVAEGRVDRIDLRGDELVIVDYKTGKHALSTDDARGSQALALYAVAARRTLRKPCARVELHHLPTGSVAVWEHTEESIGRHVARAEEAADDIVLAESTLAAGADHDEVYPPRTGRQCSWCDFRRHCPEGQEAAPTIDPWALLAP